MRKNQHKNSTPITDLQVSAETFQTLGLVFPKGSPHLCDLPEIWNINMDNGSFDSTGHGTGFESRFYIIYIFKETIEITKLR